MSQCLMRPLPSFNEAEALKPRIHAIANRIKRIHKSFNEAEALKPRIPGLGRALSIGRDLASMRPRR